MSKSLFADSAVYEITKFTTLDYSDHLACILWFAKCNMSCSYCYNAPIVRGKGQISNNQIFDFLRSRIGKLNAVVLSGGECTLYPRIVELCEEIKELGFKIKIDTNGLKPDVISELVDFSLVDFISLDYKAPPHKFFEITKNTLHEKFYKTLDMLIDKNFTFEVRTTVHSELLTPEDINAIITDLKNRKYKGIYYLQNFHQVKDTLGGINIPSRPIEKELLLKNLAIEIRN
ncbi:MAG: anaerobic ribonucleoside-triphosphate reductase activating protein [Sulfurospirillum sp.]|nr:anaerobic ribonucleoside-triphosphate reductase activating protein [Sulfurospirillum sp.]